MCRIYFIMNSDREEHLRNTETNVVNKMIVKKTVVYHILTKCVRNEAGCNKTKCLVLVLDNQFKPVLIALSVPVKFYHLFTFTSMVDKFGTYYYTRTRAVDFCG